MKALLLLAALFSCACAVVPKRQSMPRGGALKCVTGQDVVRSALVRMEEQDVEDTVSPPPASPMDYYKAKEADVSQGQGWSIFVKPDKEQPDPAWAIQNRKVVEEMRQKREEENRRRRESGGFSIMDIFGVGKKTETDSDTSDTDGAAG